jgi:hypothetical protein
LEIIASSVRGSIIDDNNLEWMLVPLVDTIDKTVSRKHFRSLRAGITTLISGHRRDWQSATGAHLLDPAPTEKIICTTNVVPTNSEILRERPS